MKRKRIVTLTHRLQEAQLLIEKHVMDTLVSTHQAGTIKFDQVMVLECLKRLGPLTSGKVQAMCYRGSNVSYTLDRLVELGFITRETSKMASVNGRTKTVTLTNKGRDLANKVANILKEVEKEIGQTFNEESLAKLTHWIENKTPQAS